MRIAILLTSNDKSDFAKRFPDDGQKFITLLRPLRPDWEYKVYPVMDDIFPNSIEDYDGVIITGSPASVHDKHPWIERLLALIRDINVLHLPMIGACFGHQAIALALGGKVDKNPQNLVLGTETTTYAKQQSWMAPKTDKVTLYAAHKEQVTELPAGAEVIGSAPGCPNAAFVIGGHIMTTEYHPEMTLDFMDELVDEMGSAITPETGSKARALYAKGEDGHLFAQWMVRFLEMPRDDH